MFHIFLVNCLLFISIILLSIVIILNGKQGNLGNKMTRFCESKSTVDFFVLIFIMSGIIMLLIHFLFLINDLINFKFVLLTVNDNNQDPVRWWPSGVPQSSAIIGSMLGTFAVLSKLNVNPRYRVLGSLSASTPWCGVSAGTITYTTPLLIGDVGAVENSVGFNRLMFGWHTDRQTGKWPSPLKRADEIAANNTTKEIDSFVTETTKQADQKTIDTIVDQIKNLDGNTNNLPAPVPVPVLVTRTRTRAPSSNDI